MTDRDSGSNDEAVGGDPAGAARPSVPVALAAGAALFNEGHPLAARDVWETAGGSLDDGDAKRLLRGLAATAAAREGAADADPEAAERAETAVGLLDDVSDPHGATLVPVREWAERLAAGAGSAGSEAADSSDADPAEAPRIRVDDGAPRFDGLSLDAVRLAAPALARAGEPGDAGAIATAADLAEAERGTGRSRFAELLFAYLRTPETRPQVAARLGDHVAIEERKRRDVDDLF